MRHAVFAMLSALLCISASAQDFGTFGGKQSLGLSTTYSPNSSHIFIGSAGQRRIWTLGLEYTRRLYQNPRLRLDYEGSILPLYAETDPTITGTSYTRAGLTVTSPQTPVRVLSTTNPIGSIAGGPGTAAAPIYATYDKQNTYGGALSPLGLRLSAMPHWRIQPTFAVDLGFVVTARDIPLDQCTQFNYMVSFGPGFQIFTTPKSAVRVEYIYRHISNADQGVQNPGIDQGVLRLTLSRHR